MPQASNPTLKTLINRLEHDTQTVRAILWSRPPATNLSVNQRNTITSRWNNIVLMCDNNLGPALMIRTDYIKQMLHDHLEDKSNTYRQLGDREAKSHLLAIKIRMSKIIVKRSLSGHLSKEETTYFTKNLLLGTYRTPQIYGMPKVHKNEVPAPLRPVVSQCGSLLSIVSTYLDFKLQPLTAHVPSYVKS